MECCGCPIALLIVIVIVIGRYEEIVLLEKVRHVLADRGANEETDHDAADDAQEAEWRSLRFRQYRSGWCGYRRAQAVRFGYDIYLLKAGHVAKQGRHSMQQHPLSLLFTLIPCLSSCLPMTVG